MAILDIVKLDVASDEFIVQKFMSENQWELRFGTQLIVNEGQEAMFLKGGVALDVFTAGTHTLVNRNGGLLNGIRFGLVCLYCSEERCFVGRIECVVTHKMPAIAVRSAGFFPTAPSDNEGRH